MSRRDMGRGEDLWGVDLGCTVRQFVSEPHDDAAFRSLFAFTVREGCLDHGPAGAGSGLAGGGRRAANGERGALGFPPRSGSPALLVQLRIRRTRVTVWPDRCFWYLRVTSV